MGRGRSAERWATLDFLFLSKVVCIDKAIKSWRMINKMDSCFISSLLETGCWRHLRASASPLCVEAVLLRLKASSRGSHKAESPAVWKGSAIVAGHATLGTNAAELHVTLARHLKTVAAVWRHHLWTSKGAVMRGGPSQLKYSVMGNGATETQAASSHLPGCSKSW